MRPCTSAGMESARPASPNKVGMMSGEESIKSSTRGLILSGKRTKKGTFMDSEYGEFFGPKRIPAWSEFGNCPQRVRHNTWECFPPNRTFLFHRYRLQIADRIAEQGFAVSVDHFVHRCGTHHRFAVLDRLVEEVELRSVTVPQRIAHRRHFGLVAACIELFGRNSTIRVRKTGFRE